MSLVERFFRQAQSAVGGTHGRARSRKRGRSRREPRPSWRHVVSRSREQAIASLPHGSIAPSLVTNDALCDFPYAGLPTSLRFRGDCVGLGGGTVRTLTQVLGLRS